MNRHLQQMIRKMFLLHHRQVQPLWTTTQVPISVPLLSNNIHFTACLLAVTCEKPKLITPSPSSSRVLKVSGRKKDRQNTNTITLIWVAAWLNWSNRERTHWRAAPGESGSTQSCQSRCGGPGCSGPRWSDAEGCWERSLPTCKMW